MLIGVLNTPLIKGVGVGGGGGGWDISPANQSRGTCPAPALQLQWTSAKGIKK